MYYFYVLGKTTQVPQYILEDSFAKKTNCNIIVTQPRRIAATSLAARVALERDCELGTLVGYKIGLDQRLDKLNHETRLLFVTTGVLLQMLSHSKGMKQYTHIILDEVHDRNIEMDFLLVCFLRCYSNKYNFKSPIFQIVIRKLLTSNSPKIILSSATLNVTKLTNYFKSLLMERPIDVPVIKIEVPRRFKIEKYYLDSFSFKLPAKLIDYRTPAISNEMYELALKPLLHCLKKSLMSEGEVRDSILVFLPGIHEINTFRKIVQQEAKFNDLAHKIVVLHSSLSPQDQREAFISSEVTKIILATNIAESSITLPDVKYVIDFCLTKYLETDSATNISSLQTHWTSKNSCKQRTGRVGRVQDGVVYRLIHADYFEVNFAALKKY